ncbi:hypothetical protein MN608_11689 [Microdochium nivale]|nr:hypothetical protein MN608_11689 [Microdochium nivale]
MMPRARGTLCPTILLEEPQRVVLGPQTPIKGHIRLRYSTRSRNDDPFLRPTPCTIDAVLSGTLEVTIDPDRTVPGAHFQKDTAQLFSKTHRVFQGEVGGLCASTGENQGMVQDYGFQICFPDFVSPDADLFIRSWGPGPADGGQQSMFDRDPTQPIPPSMSLPFKWFRQSPDSVHGAIVTVQYELAVRVQTDSPWVDVQPGKRMVRVEYERLWAGKSLEAEVQSRFGSVMVSNGGRGGIFGRTNSLGQPSLGARTSALLKRSFSISSEPRATFYNWHITCPTSIHRMQPLILQIQIQAHEGQASADTAAPPASLELVKVVATAEMQIDVLSEATWSPEWTWRPGQAYYDGRQFACVETISLKDRHFDASNGWSTLVTLATITDRLASSFRTVCVRRGYVLTVQCFVRPAGGSARRTESFTQSFGLVVHPPLASRQNDGDDNAAGLELESSVPVKPTGELDSRPLVPLGELDSSRAPMELDSREVPRLAAELDSTHVRRQVE